MTQVSENDAKVLMRNSVPRTNADSRKGCSLLVGKEMTRAGAELGRAFAFS